MPNDVATWINVIQALASVAGLIVTIWIARFVQRSSSKFSQLEFSRALRESWIHIDVLTLQNASVLRLANQYLPRREGADASFGQKRVFLLSYLSPINTAYQAARQGMYGPGTAEAVEAIKVQLVPVVSDDDGFWVTQNHGHDPDFMALCREVRESLSRPPAA